MMAIMLATHLQIHTRIVERNGLIFVLDKRRIVDLQAAAAATVKSCVLRKAIRCDYANILLLLT